MSREAILDTAFEMTKTMRLADVSFVQIAKAMAITPGSVHYHVGTRAQLTETIVMRVYENIYESLPPVDEIDGWEKALRQLLTFSQRVLSEYPGIATHLATSSERHLIRPKDAAGVDYGTKYLDWVFSVLNRAGLSAENAAHVLHLCHQHVLSSSFGELERTRPEDNRDIVLRRWGDFSGNAKAFPGLQFGIEAMAHIDTGTSFAIGVDMIIAGAKNLID